MADSAEDFRKHTEYGGGQGSPQRMRDGSGKGLTNEERARVLRIQGMAGDFDIASSDEVGTGGALSDSRVEIGGIDYAAEMVAEDARVTAVNKQKRAELEQKTNGYAGEVEFDG